MKKFYIPIISFNNLFTRLFYSLFLVIAFCINADGQVVTTFSTSGTWTVPAGVTSVTVYVYGAGGGSGGAKAALNDNASGGGGGGACAISTLSVSGGQVYNYTVGAGGTAGAATGTNGGVGGTSSFTGTGGTVSANGGGGGGGVAVTTGAAGAAGLGATVGIGTTIRFGGNGTTGFRTISNEVGGAGGGGAGNAGNGGNGSGATGINSTGGVGGLGSPTGAPYAGAAGRGATLTGGTLAGVAGIAPGGGAAGCATYSTAATGAVGGNGQIIIVYTLPACSGTPNTGTATINTASGCAGSPFTLSASGLSLGTGITYQWQSGPSATGPWTNITGATNATLTTSTATTTFYQLVTTCTSSSLNNSSNAVSYTLVSCCTNTLQCYDSFGDGWNGGSVNLIVGGALYGNYTIASGYGPTTVNFNTFSGQTIQVAVAAGGTYPTEMYFNVLNGAGTPMVSNWYPSSSGTWNGVANCPLPPTIASISPTTACGTGVSVVITGTNFTGATAVQINGVAVTSFVVNSNTQITAITSPSNTSGVVSVFNTVGSATSASSISIYPLPIITTQPGTPVAFCGGTGTSTLSVTATGAVSYQWQKNGVNISGAPYSNFTTSTLTITNPSTAENGASITCIITGAGGCTVTSLAQILSVGSSPLLPAPVTATNNTICQGQSSLLNAISTGNYINWYDAPTGGTLLSTVPSGTNFSVSPGANTTYYAEAVSINIGTPTTQTFSYTGGAQTWTVPAGVTSISVDMSGAKGGNQSAYGGSGGSGGRLQSTYPVTPGQVLNLYVGGASTSAAGGYNGGGAGPTSSSTYGGGGGGASDIRIGGTALTNRILVAGGGGGAGTDCYSNTNPGGAGGGLVGAHGWDCSTQGTTYVGKGGTQTAGGATGTLSPGTAGSLGTGGNGYAFYGGGGGGGYYGGGGGAYGGGGGGSSYSDLNASSVTHTQGYMAGNGQILISYTPIIAGCTSTSRQDVTVTVNPAPTVTAGPALSGICPGAK